MSENTVVENKYPNVKYGNPGAVAEKFIKKADGTRVRVCTYQQAVTAIGCKDMQYPRRFVSNGAITVVGREPTFKGSDVLRTLLNWDDVIKVAEGYQPRSESEGFSVELKVTPEQWEALLPTLTSLGVDYKNLTENRREYNRKRREAKRNDQLGEYESDDDLAPDVR